MPYKMIPVDEQTKERIKELMRAFGMGERAQGALVAKLVNAEYEKWEAYKLVGPKAKCPGAADKGKDAVDLEFEKIVEDTVFGEGA